MADTGCPPLIVEDKTMKNKLSKKKSGGAPRATLYFISEGESQDQDQDQGGQIILIYVLD